MNVVFGHRPLQKVVADNELLQDLGVTWLVFVDAKRDLKFQLNLQSYKSAPARVRPLRPAPENRNESKTLSHPLAQ